METYPPPVSNVVNEEKRKLVIALGQLGWSLRRHACRMRIRIEREEWSPV